MGSIEKIHEMVVSKECSCTELTKSYLDEIEKANGELNAYVNVTGEEALKTAEAVDRKIASGEEIGMLEGVPMTLKDNISTKRIETTCCSKILTGYKPIYNATVWETLAGENAVMLGKTNMDEFAMGSSCETSYFGGAMNPFDSNYVSGGSSGGVASAEDITQGLPRVEELFEARKPKHPGILAETTGVVHIAEEGGQRKITITDKDGMEEVYAIPYGAKLAVTEGQEIEKGDRLTEGSLNPHDIIRISGVRATQRYLVQQVLGVYKSQGVEINDKHIEVMVRQMMRKVRIDEAGDTTMLPGEYVDIGEFEEQNSEMLDRGLQPAEGHPILLGITKASLATDSFLSAASFQETTRVLTDAAIKGKVDPLLGLKENVIIGKLIPAGTGMSRYRDVKVKYNNVPTNN